MRSLTEQEKRPVREVVFVGVPEPQALLTDGRAATYDTKKKCWVLPTDKKRKPNDEETKL